MPSDTPTAPARPTLVESSTPIILPSAVPTQLPTELPVITTGPETPPTPAAGLVVRGHVRLADGNGLAGVTVCRSYAAYPAVAIAISGADGWYESAFAAIPGDEMVTLMPVAQGYSFDPPMAYWRHYHGAEERTQDFVASPSVGAPASACP